MLERRLVEPDQVRQFRIFRDLDDKLVDEVRRQARVTPLQARESLFHQNEPMQWCFFCLSGRIKLFRTTFTGSEKVFRIVGTGDTLLDSLAYAADREYPLDAVAIVASEVMVLGNEFTVDLCNRSQPTRNHLIESLLDRTASLIDHVELLSVDKAGYRVASFLHAEYVRHGRIDVFRLPSSKKHIASLLSLQPETLSRCLKNLSSDGIARSNAREIEILDADALRRMVSDTRIAA